MATMMISPQEITPTAPQSVQAAQVRLLLTVDEAAAALGIGRVHFYTLLGNGDTGIVTVKLGRRRLVVLESLRAYVKRLAEEAESEAR